MALTKDQKERDQKERRRSILYWLSRAREVALSLFLIGIGLNFLELGPFFSEILGGILVSPYFMIGFNVLIFLSLAVQVAFLIHHLFTHYSDGPKDPKKKLWPLFYPIGETLSLFAFSMASLLQLMSVGSVVFLSIIAAAGLGVFCAFKIGEEVIQLFNFYKGDLWEHCYPYQRAVIFGLKGLQIALYLTLAVCGSLMMVSGFSFIPVMIVVMVAALATVLNKIGIDRCMQKFGAEIGLTGKMDRFSSPSYPHTVRPRIQTVQSVRADAPQEIVVLNVGEGPIKETTKASIKSLIPHPFPGFPLNTVRADQTSVAAETMSGPIDLKIGKQVNVNVMYPDPDALASDIALIFEQCHKTPKTRIFLLVFDAQNSPQKIQGDVCALLEQSKPSSQDILLFIGDLHGSSEHLKKNSFGARDIQFLREFCPYLASCPMIPEPVYVNGPDGVQTLKAKIQAIAWPDELHTPRSCRGESLEQPAMSVPAL